MMRPGARSPDTITTKTKSSTGSKRSIWSPFIIEESLGRDQETGTETEAMEGYGLLVFPADFLRQARPPARGWHCPTVLGPPMSITNQENVPQTCLQVSLMKVIFSFEVP